MCLSQRESRDRQRAVLPPSPIQPTPLLAGRDRGGGAGLSQRASCARQLGDAQDQTDARLAATHSHYHVHFKPTSTSWINQVDRWFGFMTLRAIRRGVQCSVEELKRDIQASNETTNADPKSFRWVMSADATLASVKRFYLRALDTEPGASCLPLTSRAEH